MCLKVLINKIYMKTILIVEAPYYEKISEELSLGAIEEIKKSGFAYEKLIVSGAFEIPAAINFASQSKKYSGFIALGCVIRGETTHYDYVCGESARGLMDLSLQKNLAIGFGILTVENEKQAMARASRKKYNKGAEAAKACIEMIEIKNKFTKTKK
jgi:6,7-dimethyl-8-ribityllumazine synthase